MVTNTAKQAGKSANLDLERLFAIECGNNVCKGTGCGCFRVSKDEILFEQNGRAGVVTLNKPETLNAVTDAMLSALNNQLDVWENDASVERVIIKAAEGRAFSAGGDIRHLYERGIAGDFDYDFFAREYTLNARIHHFPKPYIAMIDGIAMGGGVGISFHGSHRIAGEKIGFAMPEVGIGFFPDVGGSYLLSRLPGALGLYLGMTGERMKQGDVLESGLATHACASADFPRLEDELCNSKTIENAIGLFVDGSGERSQIKHMTLINSAFAADSVAHIVANLESMTDLQGQEGEWARQTLDKLHSKSPTSLEIAFRQIVRGASLSMKDCMRMEYRILRRILSGSEFYEGIRAAIIDKDYAPKWEPSALADVDLNRVEEHFAGLGAHELALP